MAVWCHTAVWHCSIVAIWQYVTIVMWHYGTLVLWYYGTMVLWHLGTMALWYCGIMALWYCDIKVLWYYGIVELWNYGTVALWRVALVPTGLHLCPTKVPTTLYLLWQKKNTENCNIWSNQPWVIVQTSWLHNSALIQFLEIQIKISSLILKF